MNYLATPRVARELTWTIPLLREMRGVDVRRMQEWLALRGHATALDGDFGPATQRALLAFAGAQRLPCDGSANLTLLHALVAPLRRAFAFEVEAPTFRETVVAVARQHASQHPREVGGDNRGPWVRAYCGRDGKDYAWCAGAACTIVAQACAIRDMENPLGYTLGCDELAGLAQHGHRLTRDPRSIRAGDLFLCHRTTPRGALDYYHTGIVTAMHAESMETIEGNTNDDGSANGFELVARTRGLARKDYVRLG